MAGSILEYASQSFHERLRRRLGHTSKSVLPPQSLTQEATRGSTELDVGFNELLRNIHSIIDQLVQSIQNPGTLVDVDEMQVVRLIRFFSAGRLGRRRILECFKPVLARCGQSS